MRRSKEDAAKTRARVVADAARLFRSGGISATSVADVMSAAGLTVGGFYRHFDSKEDLVVEAIEAASHENVDMFYATSASGEAGEASAALDTYLSDVHRRHPGHGCPVAALCSEVGHGSKATKRVFTKALERLVTALGTGGEGSAKTDRAHALFTTAAAVGALVLARATDDDLLARELLAAAHERLIQRPD